MATAPPPGNLPTGPTNRGEDERRRVRSALDAIADASEEDGTRTSTTSQKQSAEEFITKSQEDRENTQSANTPKSAPINTSQQSTLKKIVTMPQSEAELPSTYKTGSAVSGSDATDASQAREHQVRVPELSGLGDEEDKPAPFGARPATSTEIPEESQQPISQSASPQSPQSSPEDSTPEQKDTSSGPDSLESMRTRLETSGSMIPPVDVSQTRLPEQTTPSNGQKTEQESKPTVPKDLNALAQDQRKSFAGPQDLADYLTKASQTRLSQKGQSALASSVSSGNTLPPEKETPQKETSEEPILAVPYAQRQTPSEDSGVSDALQAQAVFPNTQQKKPSELETELDKTLAKQQGDKSRIRTFESDAAQAVKRGRASLTRIAAAEARHREHINAEQKEQKGRKQRTFKLILLITLLIIAGLVVVFVMATRSGVLDNIFPQQESPAELLRKNNILVVDEYITFDTTVARGQTLLSVLLDQAREQRLVPGSVLEIDPVDRARDISLPAADFFASLETDAPVSLSRSFDGEYIVGSHVLSNEEPSLFMVYKIDFFENAFAAMLNWEATMRNDLDGIVPTYIPSTDTESSESEDATDNLLLNDSSTDAVFQDVVILNRDTRILFDEFGEVELLYSFPNRRTLIITTNIATFREVLDRISRVRSTL